MIDTRKGAVRLDSRGAGGKLDSGVFSDGLFKVTQTRGAKPVTELTLVEPLACPKAKRANAAAPRRRSGGCGATRRATSARAAATAAPSTPGTKWMVEDRCDGTLFRVERGTILVTQERLAQDACASGPAAST